MGPTAPVDTGVVELIVRRPAEGEREVLDEAELEAVLDGSERPSNEGRLAEPARGDEEYLLAGHEVVDQTRQFLDAICEGSRWNDFAVDERIGHYVI